MISFMTLQNSLDERKLKNYQAFEQIVIKCLIVCVCVCVCGWGCLFSVTGIEGGLIRDRQRERGFYTKCLILFKYLYYYYYYFSFC